MRRVDPIILLLTILLMIFAAILMACEKFWYQDAVLFAVISGVLNNISGALFMGIRSHLGIPEAGTKGKITEQSSIEVEGTKGNE